MKAPCESPKQGSGIYTEAFQGLPRLGSQTVLLGSEGLPRGHTFNTLSRLCPESAGK